MQQRSAQMAGSLLLASSAGPRSFGRSWTEVLLGRLKGGSGLLTDIEFSRDGQYAVAASRDGTARMWRVLDGADPIVLEGHDGAVSSAAFSPNGLYVLTTSSQGSHRDAGPNVGGLPKAIQRAAERR